MSHLQQYLQAELALRNNLKQRVLDLVSERCVLGSGKVRQGQLHCYLYYKLGFYGRIGYPFVRFFNKLLAEAGLRAGWNRGQRCFYGISWRGEDDKDWRVPLAKDLPYKLPDGKGYRMREDQYALLHL